MRRLLDEPAVTDAFQSLLAFARWSCSVNFTNTGSVSRRYHCSSHRESTCTDVARYLLVLALGAEATMSAAQEIDTYRVTRPVSCVTAANSQDGAPEIRNNCHFGVYVAYCVDAAVGATDNTLAIKCSALRQVGRGRGESCR